MTFFFTTVIPVYPMNKHEYGRSESFRGRQKFGTNRKQCSTNVKQRHVGINRRLIVQFKSNPRVQRLQNGHTNFSASGSRATTTLLNMRFLSARLHVICVRFARPLRSACYEMQRECQKEVMSTTTTLHPHHFFQIFL